MFLGIDCSILREFWEITQLNLLKRSKICLLLLLVEDVNEYDFGVSKDREFDGGF